MKVLTRGLMTIALVAATAACDGSPTAGSQAFAEPGGPVMAGASTFSFNHTPSYDYATRTSQTASGGVGGIDFAGHMQTSHPCYNVSASRSVRQTSVTVTVTANDNGNTCMQAITYQNYTGQVSGLAPGAYTFTVLHVRDGVQETAWTGPVTVQ